MSELYNPLSIFDFKSLRTIVKYGDLEILTNDADTIVFRCGGMGIAYNQKVNAWSSPLNWPEHSGVSLKQLWGKSQIEELLPLQEEINKPSLIPMAHENKFHCNECEDEREHYHNHTATGTLLMLNDVPIAQLPEPKEGQDSWGICDRNGKHVATIPCKIEHDTITVPSFELPTTETWLCVNHPPGSEIEVKKGEKCFCGRTE